MPPKALTRCELCKNWQAIYVVEDPQFGKIKVCHKCWQSRYKGMQVQKEPEKKPPKGERS